MASGNQGGVHCFAGLLQKRLLLYVLASEHGLIAFTKHMLPAR
jgi:hypothetical protein